MDCSNNILQSNENFPEYKVGEKVYIKESEPKSKSKNKFNGPFEISQLFLNSARFTNL